MANFDEFIVTDTPDGPGGAHHTVWRFPNGYGASLICGGAYAYGGLEMAVVQFTGDSDDFHIVYDTGITNDVIGHLRDDEVEVYLRKVKDL